VALLVGAALAVPASSAVAAARFAGPAAAADSLLSVSMGGRSILTVPGVEAPVAHAPSVTLSVGSESSVAVSVGGKPLVGASAGGEHLAAVSVGGKAVASVPAPTPPPSGEPPLAHGEETAPAPTPPPHASSGQAPKPLTTAAVAMLATSSHPAPRSAARAPTATSPTSLVPAGGARLTSAGAVRRATRRAGAARTSPLDGSPTPATAAHPRQIAAGDGSRVQRSTNSSSNPLQAIGRHIPIPLPIPDWSKPIILALVLLSIGLAIRAALASRRARRLETQHGVLLRDLGAMQAALVPEVPADLEGASVSVAYRPAEGPGAGGDFYDVFVPSPGKVAMILGDVTGHGHDALRHAALTRYTVRAYLQAGLAPRAALALAGEALVDEACERLATVAAALYDSDAGTLTYALAGHPPPLLRGVEWPEPSTCCSSPPVGWTMPTGRRQTVISLPDGAIACFLSDGLIEARCGGTEEAGRLGRGRLAEILDSLDGAADAESLLSGVRAAAQSTPDDMAAVILLPHGPLVTERLHVEELEADPRALAGGYVRAFLEGFALSGRDVEDAVREAIMIAAARGSAVLRLDLTGEGTVSVGAPLAPKRTIASPPRRARSGSARLRLVGAS